jgi:hypothetical protein
VGRDSGEDSEVGTGKAVGEEVPPRICDCKLHCDGASVGL